MPNLIKNNNIEVDAWELVQEGESASQANQVLFPITQLNALSSVKDSGVWLDSDTQIEQLAELIGKTELIAINFPKFADGRGYSLARILRDQLKFDGEIRAVGDVLLDQVFYMSRVGFDAYSLRDDKDAQKVQAMLATFSDSYQISVDKPVPLFRRRG
ncbi:DUF934 domain-containing protein [Marinicellulosiphila megalodicopiae]|uniref:DUF934 domain-containing protein n=1 Tax=Marinicellulosiphila megalodicopiae TaxID=2724896 RepID=UPI003BAF5BD5